MTIYINNKGLTTTVTHPLVNIARQPAHYNYNYYSSPVDTCFLDTSKAFDRINHWTMSKQLLVKNVPIILIRILCFWYRSQERFTLWGNTRSSSFLLFQMVFGKVEYYLLSYSLYLWTISLSY